MSWSINGLSKSDPCPDAIFKALWKHLFCTSWTWCHCNTTRSTFTTSLSQQFSKQQGITWRSAVKLRGGIKGATRQHGISSGSTAEDFLPDVRTEELIWMNGGSEVQWTVLIWQDLKEQESFWKDTKGFLVARPVIPVQLFELYIISYTLVNYIIIITTVH